MSVFNRLQAIFGETPDSATPETSDQSDIDLACAALLVEIARADYADDPRETKATFTAIRKVLKVPETDIAKLLSEANTEVKEGTSVFPQTSLINEHCSREQKYDILVAMWQVAFADGNLDKYEEHLIRRIAGLIHLDHSEFIQAKIEAKSCNSEIAHNASEPESASKSLVKPETVNVIITDCGPINHNAAKVLQELKQASSYFEILDLLRDFPKVAFENLPHEDAEKIKAHLEATGCTVELH